MRLRRIINEPARKIGATTIEKIGELAAGKGVPMLEIIAHVRDYPELQRAAAALERFYEMYRELCDLSVSEPLDQFVGDVIAKSGYEAMLKAMKEEGETRRENPGPARQLHQDLRRPERRGRHPVRLFGGGRADFRP